MIITSAPARERLCLENKPQTKLTETFYANWEAAVAQRLSGENEKINEIKRTWVCSPPRATSFKKLSTLMCENAKKLFNN
jgi:hypothetical protein